MARRAHQLHVILGASTGLVLLLVCVSGVFALFRFDLVRWNTPEASCAAPWQADRAYAQLAGELAHQASPVRRLSLPALTGATFELRLANGKRAEIDSCGQPPPRSRAGVGDYLVNLHTRLFLGKSGRWIVGAMGVVMLATLVSGVLAHRKFLSQAFTLRRGRGQRLANADTHKLLGVWLLGFHLLTAVSGAWLGLSPLFIAADKGVKAAAASAWEAPPPLEPLFAEAQARVPGFVPVFIDFFPERGHASVRGNLPGELAQRYRAEVLFDGDGRVLGVHDPRTLPAGVWLNQAMMPLHFGDWGGGIVQWTYAVFGVGSVTLIWLGLWLWAERLLHRRGSVWPRGGTARKVVIETGLPAIVTACVVSLATVLWLPVAAGSQSALFLTSLTLSAIAWLGATRWLARLRKPHKANARD